jgi:hypothetical protein
MTVWLSASCLQKPQGLPGQERGAMLAWQILQLGLQSRRYGGRVRLHLRQCCTRWTVGLPLALLAVLLTTSEALAVRPFVTDDARIVNMGQFETESWGELRLQRGNSPGYHVASLQGYSPTDRLEIIGGVIGLDYAQRRLSFDDVVLQPKYLIYRSLNSLMPSISSAVGWLSPISGNRQQWNNYAMFHASWFLFTPQGSTDPYDNGLAIHVNLGMKGQYDAGRGGRQSQKLYWAMAFETITFSRDIRFLGEIFNGDPFVYEEEFPAFQTGFRWYKSPNVQWDIVMGGVRSHEALSQMNYTVQIGFRWLFDVRK